MVAVELAHAEALDLATAWLDYTAASHGIRSLTIKGDALALFDLRSPRVSADVDVLIDPARFDDYQSLLRQSGWEVFPSTFQSENFTTHSVTLYRDGWPISIDVHRHYPGFLRPASEVFDLLWQRRSTLTFAQRRCAIPDRPSSAIMLALHSLRSISDSPRHDLELDQVRNADFSADERSAIAELALATGSAAPLSGLLEEWGVDILIPPAEFESREYRRWMWKTTGARGSTTQATVAEWLGMLSHTPWQGKARVLFRAFWPTRSDILLNNPSLRDAMWPILLARLSRIVRGARAVPHVVIWRISAKRTKSRVKSRSDRVTPM